VGREGNIGFGIYKNHGWKEEILKSMQKRIKGENLMKTSNSLVKDCRIEQYWNILYGIRCG
jgi:hypothetical protein